MALRGHEMRPLKREKHTALEAWKPAKNAGSHIPTAAAATASKGTKNQIPRQMRSFPLSCVEPVIHSVKTILETGVESAAATYITDENRSVPPKDLYTVITIDTILSGEQVTDYITRYLCIAGTVTVQFSNALGKPDRAEFKRLITCTTRGGAPAQTQTHGHVSKSSRPCLQESERRDIARFGRIVATTTNPHQPLIRLVGFRSVTW
jgi:hypothetical protein